MMNPVATRTITAAPRDSISQLQRELITRQRELASGKIDDLGLARGGSIRRNLELERTLIDISSFKDVNAITGARLAGTQNALKSIMAGADAMATALITARDAPSSGTILEEKGMAAASDLARALNTEVAGIFVFGGENGSAPPVADLTAPGPGAAAKAATEAAFTTFFGFAPDDPSAAAITDSQIKAFYDGPLSALFDASGWKANWSVAGDAALTTGIAPNQFTEAGSSANRSGFNDLMKAYSAAGLFGGISLNAGARGALADSARDTIISVRADIAAVQSQTGFSEERLTRANQSLEDMELITARAKGGIENADPFETATRINAIITGIEASYALTARLQKLSLTQYL
jgi:flagellar hook-associated protein 3 FlgL